MVFYNIDYNIKITINYQISDFLIFYKLSNLNKSQDDFEKSKSIEYKVDTFSLAKGLKFSFLTNFKKTKSMCSSLTDNVSSNVL